MLVKLASVTILNRMNCSTYLNYSLSFSLGNLNIYYVTFSVTHITVNPCVVFFFVVCVLMYVLCTQVSLEKEILIKPRLPDLNKKVACYAVHHYAAVHTFMEIMQEK